MLPETQVLLAEIVSTILGLASVFLLARGDGRGWSLGALMLVLSAFVYQSKALPASAILQLLFLGTQFLGWWRWKRGAHSDLIEESKNLSGPQAVVLLPLLGALWALIYFGIGSHSGNLAVLDAFLAAGSLIAQTLLVLGFRQSWLCWIFVDILYVGLNLASKLWFFSLLYLAFTVLAFLGWIQWTREDEGSR